MIKNVFGRSVIRSPSYQPKAMTWTFNWMLFGFQDKRMMVGLSPLMIHEDVSWWILLTVQAYPGSSSAWVSALQSLQRLDSDVALGYSTMSMGLACLCTIPTVLTRGFEIVVLLDKVCSTGQATTANITIFGPRAPKQTAMSSAAAKI